MLQPVQAQLFSRESLGGAAAGGLIGGIIGHNNGRKTAEGIGIGAGAGLLLGALAENSRRDVYISTPGPMIAAPVYPYYPVRPNYTVTGAALGGVAGGIIGHNSGRRTAEGIAIGAGSGLVLGVLAEENARRKEVVFAAPASPQARALAVAPRTAVPAIESQSPGSTSQSAPIISNSYASPSPMSGANALFGR